MMQLNGVIQHSRNFSKARKRRWRSFPWIVYVLVLPAITYRVFWTGWPLVQTASLSFTNSNFIYGTSEFVGFENYVEMMKDGAFWKSLIITMAYATILVVATTGLGLVVAKLLTRVIPGQALGRVSLLIPYIIPTVLAAQIWLTLTANSGSPVNALLKATGLVESGIPWLSEAWAAQLLVVFASVWRAVPFAALLFMAALTSLPKEIHEAGAVDGAGAWRRFWSIDLPLVMNTVLVVVIFQTIEALRAFDVVYGLTKGGPGDATGLLSYRAYQDMFFYGQSGFGSAETMVLLMLTILVVGALSLWLVRTQRRTS